MFIFFLHKMSTIGYFHVTSNTVTRYTTQPNIMNEVKQETINKQWLYGQGWTIQEAANYLGVHRVHLNLVLSGERSSKRLMAKVVKLPHKKLELRKNIKK